METVARASAVPLSVSSDGSKYLELIDYATAFALITSFQYPRTDRSIWNKRDCHNRTGGSQAFSILGRIEVFGT